MVVVVMAVLVVVGKLAVRALLVVTVVVAEREARS